MRLSRETLAGERVVLRPVRPGDAAAYARAVAGDPVLETSARAARALFRRDETDRAAGLAARFAAVVDGAFAGLFSLHTLTEGAAECGVYVVPVQRRRGIATEALALLVAWARPLQVRFTTTPGNVAARRLAAVAGLEVAWAA